jgi:hypothetical protein
MLRNFLFVAFLLSVLAYLPPEYDERYASMVSDNYTELGATDSNVLVDKTSITTIQRMSFDDLTEEEKLEVLERLKSSDLFSNYNNDASSLPDGTSPLTNPVRGVNSAETPKYRNDAFPMNGSSSSTMSLHNSESSVNRNDASSMNNSFLSHSVSDDSGSTETSEYPSDVFSEGQSSSFRKVFSDSQNITETAEYQNLTVQYETLQHSYQIHQDFIHQLQEKYDNVLLNHSLSEVQYKLLLNELNMNKLIQEQAKLKFEELSLRYEEKISFYQKEVNRLGSQLKESQRKNVAAAKLNCSAYCSQEVHLPAGITRSCNQGEIFGGINSSSNTRESSFSPFRNFFQSISSLAFKGDLENKGDLNSSIEGKPDRSRISLLYPSIQALLDGFLGLSVPQIFGSFPLLLLGFIYYEYSFLFYLAFQYFPLNYPDIVDYILSPIWQLFYHRLGISFVLLSLRSFYYSLYDHDILADILNDISWKLYHFVQFLENEEDTSVDYLVMLYEKINSDYVLNNSLVNSVFSSLSTEGQQWIKEYVLLICISLIGTIILFKTYRIIFGVLLILLVIAVAPWLMLLSIPLNIFILLLAVLERSYSFLFATKKVSDATTPAEPTRRVKIKRVHGHNRHFQHSDITHLPPPDQII